LTTLNKTEIESIVACTLADPFTMLGAHPTTMGGEKGVMVRAFLPRAQRVEVLDLNPNKEQKAKQVHEAGLFEAWLPGVLHVTPYRLRAGFDNGMQSVFYDCYAFLPVLGDDDLYLFNQGSHDRIYEKLGAHPLIHQGVSGVLFAVWAPSASRVSVLGDFNQWDGRRHPMRVRGVSGIWELFIPQLKPGALYKFEIRTQDGTLLIKSDPYAFFFEKRPRTAAIVHDMEGFEWTDRGWMEKRPVTNMLKEPLAIYEVHLGSWKRRRDKEKTWLTYRESADELVDYVQEMGFTHVQFLPLAEHPFDGSWGYQVTGYYAPTSRFGSPQDFMYLVNRCHAAGIGVILDWVPAHFPKDPHALEFFDGTHLYEHADPRQAEHKDWGTLIFNYGRNEVRNFLIANALFWFDTYHIDAIRVDAVASMLYLDYSRKEGEWIPNRYGGRENLEAIEFLQELNTRVFRNHPGVMTIAEESTDWPGVTRPAHLGGLGFLFKWNMGWMHDMLTFMSLEPVYRSYHTENLTFALLYAFDENFVLPLSHDEVVHGKASLLSKMPGDDWQKFANLRLLLGYMYGEPGKKTLFMGGEFGQRAEWNHDQELQWDLLQYEPHACLQRYVRDLNHLYRREPALYELDYDQSGFQWIDFRNSGSTVISFMRKAGSSGIPLVFVFNFTPVPRENYRIGVPVKAFYREVLNSDSTLYGGSNVGNVGGRTSDPIPAHGFSHSISLSLPPLAMLILKPE
jgi:1,4-alpha-glucan branching enzyme